MVFLIIFRALPIEGRPGTGRKVRSYLREQGEY
jgi:hypothetical protein